MMHDGDGRDYRLLLGKIEIEVRLVDWRLRLLHPYDTSTTFQRRRFSKNNNPNTKKY
jgi:hypothetical protein